MRWSPSCGPISSLCYCASIIWFDMGDIVVNAMTAPFNIIQIRRIPELHFRIEPPKTVEPMDLFIYLLLFGSIQQIQETCLVRMVLLLPDSGRNWFVEPFFERFDRDVSPGERGSTVGRVIISSICRSLMLSHLHWNTWKKQNEVFGQISLLVDVHKHAMTFLSSWWNVAAVRRKSRPVPISSKMEPL